MPCVNVGCSGKDKKTALYPSIIHTSRMIFVVLLTFILAVCIFLNDTTKYIPMYNQPKLKVSVKSVMENMHTNIAAHVTFLYSHGPNKILLIQ